MAMDPTADGTLPPFPEQGTLPFYITGGTLPLAATSYVERAADTSLMSALKKGEFCYILNTRQIGKSSLMARTASHLRVAGAAVAVLDLTAIGQNLTVAQWYKGLLVSIGEQLAFDQEMRDYWAKQSEVGPMQRFLGALRDVALPAVTGALVIFIDEIDAVRSLPFSTDELFAGIRELYNQRSRTPDLSRLTFCLLGVATPADLIRDTRTTPFNIGTRIDLTDFTLAEARPLAQGMVGGQAILDRVLYWTGGHPYLTQRLCRVIAEEEAAITNPAQVDALCERLFLTKQAQDTDDNLAFVRDRLLRSEVDLAGLLDLYQQVWAGRRVRDDETNLLIPTLRLSGVVSVHDGLLRTRNRTYYRVFDNDWVSAHMPDAEKRRQATAYRRGVLRTAALASVVVLLLALLSVWAFHESHAAQVSALKANQEEKTAVDAAQEADAEKEKAQNLLQVADLQFAGQTFNSETGTAALANSLLAASRTGQLGHPGTERFEWRYQWGLAHNSAAIVQSQATGAFPSALVAVTPDGVLTVLDASFHLHRVRLGSGQAFWQEAAARFAVNNQVLQAKPNCDLSSDGILVASGTNDGRIIVRDTADLRRIASWGHGETRGLTSLQFLQHHRILRGYFQDGNQSTTDWDAHTGQILSHWTKEQLPQLSPEGGGCVWSPDGRYTAILINDQKTPQIQIIDMTRTNTEGYMPITIELPQFYLTVAFSPNGKILAGGDYSGRVTLLDTASGRQKQILQALGLGTEVDALTFSADGNTLAVGGQDGLIRLWSLLPSPAVLLGAFKGHTDGIIRLQFSPNGKWLASSDSGGTVRAWNLGSLRASILHAGQNAFFDSLVFSPEGRWLASSVDSGQAKLWDTQTWQQQLLPKCSNDGAFRGGKQKISAFAFSADGRTVATAGEVEYEPVSATKNRSARSESATLFVQFWDRRTKQPGPRWEAVLDGMQGDNTQMSGGLHALAFSPDGRTLAGGFGQFYEVPQQEPHGDRIAVLWDVSTGHLRRTLTGFHQGITSLSYSPDGRSLAVGCMDQTVRCFDTRSWTLARTFAAQDFVTSVAYSLDGRTLAFGEWSGLIRLTNTHTWATQSLIGHSDTVRDLSFSQDSLTLASASDDGTVKLWDAVTGRETRTLSVDGQKLYRVAFSPTGNLLASGDSEGNVHLWHAAPAVRITAWEKQEIVNPILHGTGVATKSRWLMPSQAPKSPPFLKKP